MSLSLAEDQISHRFLCEPAQRWVYAESQSYFAMLGLGPIQEGYSIIAAREHTRGMFDASASERAELIAFTQHVRELLAPYYGEALVTEHGRVAPCVEARTRSYEPHCLHASSFRLPWPMGLPSV